MGCSNKDTSFSNWPKSGPLRKNLDTNLSTLQKKNLTNTRVDSYIVSSVKNNNGSFIQKGCGPNWDGGVLSQCTCRPDLRARKKIENWKDTWISGLTSSKLGENYLFYLMKVEYPIASFKKLYEFYDEETRNAKSMSRNPRGDLYIPLDGQMDEWSVESYEVPFRLHSHRKKKSRKKDISNKYHGRHPTLLVGYQEYSFIWTKPYIKVKTPLGTASRAGRIYQTLTEFLDDLATVNTV
jgi:hypothetical protein